MRFLAALSTIAAVVVVADQDLSQPLSEQFGYDPPRYVPEIEVIAPNKTYDVKLECFNCPLAFRGEDNTVDWEPAPQANALRLRFHIDTEYHEQPSLTVNARSILPLDSINPYFLTPQMPANMTTDMLGGSGIDIAPWGELLIPEYEHTVLRTQEHGRLWVQLDISGMVPRDASPSCKALRRQDQEGQKLVQLLLRQEKDTNELSIEDIQIVTRAERVQPYRMKCGRLAMVQTFFDPQEWDDYGKFGTWERTLNLMTGKIGEFWSDMQQSPFVLLLAIVLASGVVMLRRWYQKRQQEKYLAADDAETALLSSEYTDAPPAYTDIPVIKIEEYD